jgi:cyclohexyl-isocyanide hydratase
MQYHPEPPFDAGTPDRAPPQVLESARNSVSKLTADRLATAKKISAQFGVKVPGLAG